MSVEKETEAERAGTIWRCLAVGPVAGWGCRVARLRDPTTVFHGSLEASPHSLVNLQNHSIVTSIPEADKRMRGCCPSGQPSGHKLGFWQRAAPHVHHEVI